MRLRSVSLLLVQVSLPTLLPDQAQLVPDGGQSLVGVVLAQQQAVFRAAGHHAVGVGAALGDQVVDQGADIAGSAVEDERFLALHPARGIDAGNQALGRRFLVAGGSVKLSGAVQARYLDKFERGFQVERVDAVVLDGVGVAHDLHPLKTDNRAVERELHILRQRGGKPLQVHLLGV